MQRVDNYCHSLLTVFVFAVEEEAYEEIEAKEKEDEGTLKVNGQTGRYSHPTAADDSIGCHWSESL